jgi:glycine reductase complex component B subunit gamma
MSNLRVIHYLNQFFGGIGGEDKAGVGVSVRTDLPGPSRLLQQTLGSQGKVVATLLAGDNFASQQSEKFKEEAIAHIRNIKADLLIAGPAFNAGRYGMACGFLCQQVKDLLGIPAVTGMYGENPGVETYRSSVTILKTGSSPVDMAESVKRLVDLGTRLARGESLGPAAKEGIFGRGLRRNQQDPLTAAERAVQMLLQKTQGFPYESEIPIPKFPPIAPAPPLKDVKKAKLAIVTTGGIVPKGNPDRLPFTKSTKWGSYSIEGLNSLTPKEFQSIHRGFDTTWANQDPNRVLPLDGLRDLQARGLLGEIHPRYYITTGSGTFVKDAVSMAKEITIELENAGVQGILLIST